MATPRKQLDAQGDPVTTPDTEKPYVVKMITPKKSRELVAAEGMTEIGNGVEGLTRDQANKLEPVVRKLWKSASRTENKDGTFTVQRTTPNPRPRVAKAATITDTPVAEMPARVVAWAAPTVVEAMAAVDAMTPAQFGEKFEAMASIPWAAPAAVPSE